MNFCKFCMFTYTPDDILRFLGKKIVSFIFQGRIDKTKSEVISSKTLLLTMFSNLD